MKLTDLTAVARSIDLHYPTNRAIAILAGGIAVVGAAVQPVIAGHLRESGPTPGWAPAIGWGVSAGLAVFLAWALARELDPDRDLAAFVAAGLTLLGLLFLELPTLLPLFWLLVLVRVLNRIIGFPARIPDSLLLLTLGGWLTWQGHWIYGLATAVAFLLDGLMSKPLRRHLFFAAIALTFTAGISVLRDRLAEAGSSSSGASLTGSWPLLLLLTASTLLFLPVIRATRGLHSLCDATGNRADPRRVQATQLVALLAALLLARWQGASGVEALLPLWAAILGTGVYFAFTQILSRRTPVSADASPVETKAAHRD